MSPKNDNMNPYTFKQNVALTIRGLKYLENLPKPIIIPKTLVAIVNAIAPIVNIYFSAMILDELAGGRTQSRLVSLVVFAIGVNLTIMLVKSMVTRWDMYCSSYRFHSVLNFFSDKAMSMDFIDMEDPKIRQEYYKILQYHTGTAHGFSSMIFAYNIIITGLMQVMISAGIAIYLFTIRVPESSHLQWLNLPISRFVFIFILASSTFLAPYISTRGGNIFAKAADANARGNRIYTSYVTNMIEGESKVKDIHIYNQECLINEGLTEYSYFDVWQPLFNYASKYNALGSMVTHLANGLLYLFVALHAYAGSFGVGSIVLYVGAIIQFSNGMSTVLRNIGWLYNNNIYLGKIFDYLDIPNKMHQGLLSVERDKDCKNYEIAFCNVSFKYPNSKIYALKNINLKFTPGYRMAIVGQNGSGKTTLIKLLCRLYDPTDGIITLNGVDIKKYDYYEYMAIFSVVFQDFGLLPLTLGQNIATAISYDDTRVMHALDLVGFKSRLEEMPEGLETYLYKSFEEEGVEISGGEAQKIAMARALYKNSPFVILDEPTAALDPLAEADMYVRFNEIVEGKTATYISHRLSSCRFCDDIIVLHEGCITQQGSHDDLIQDLNGKYHELWQAQAQYYNKKAV